jgi:outer membrane lipoprotein-sorting protein
MKMGRISGIIALLSYIMGGGISIVHGQDLQEIIRNIDEQQQKIQTLIASFSQKKETSLAKDPLISGGVVKFKRPDRIHFLYVKPEPMEMALDGKTVRIYYPGRSQAEKYSLVRSKKMIQYLEPVIGVFQKTFAQLSEGYKITYQSLEADPMHRFRLRPREEKLQKYLSSVDLWIDKTSGAVLKFEMIEASKDRLILEFKDLQINPPLTDDDLTVIIPPAAKVLEQSMP